MEFQWFIAVSLALGVNHHFPGLQHKAGGGLTEQIEIGVQIEECGKMIRVIEGVAEHVFMLEAYRGTNISTLIRPAEAEPEHAGGPPCRFSSGVCGLPLDAKIAATIILSILATGIWLYGWIGLLNGRRNIAQALACGALGLGLIALIAPIVLWGSTY